MSEHPALWSSVGSRSSELPSHHHLQPQPRPDGNSDPLSSAWIRRLHLTTNPAPPSPPHQDAEEPPKPPPRTAGFGPFRWSPRPLRGAPLGAWDAAAAPVGSGGDPPMLSPFFLLPAPPVADIGELAPARPLIGVGSGSGGFPGLSSRIIVGGDPHTPWLATGDAGTAYPSHPVDMVPIGTFHDIHDRQHNVIPQNFARHAHGPSSQHDEPFSYWNMGRLQRNTITSSISPVVVAPGNFGKKRNADSSSFLPLKFRKLRGAF